MIVRVANGRCVGLRSVVVVQKTTRVVTWYRRNYQSVKETPFPHNSYPFQSSRPFSVKNSSDALRDKAFSGVVEAVEESRDVRDWFSASRHSR